MPGLHHIFSALVLFYFGSNDVFGQVAFKEVAMEWGIEHYHHNLNYVGAGGGVAVFDFNNDGFQDLYFTGGWFPDELFKNNGNGSFTKIGKYAGLEVTDYYDTKSIIVGDINNDGYKDLFISTDGSLRNLIFLNNRNGTFTEIGGIYDTKRTLGSVFGDFNLDGILDLYNLKYAQSGGVVLDENNTVIGFDHKCMANELYLNNGDLTFTELASSGVGDEGCGLAVVVTDINDDHIPDLYIANDFGEWTLPNGCYINNYPEDSFTDVSSETGLNAPIYGMGIAVGDYNRDGFLDYYVTNIGSNVLYRNEGNGEFIDVASESRVLDDSVNGKFVSGWGTAFFDYDLDGFEDLFVSNGYLQAASFIGTSFEQPNKLYRNLGDGIFEDVSELENVADSNIAKGMAVGDLDNDGDLEIIVTAAGDDRNTGNVLIYENLLENDNNWLKVKLRGVVANLDGYGAKVIAYYSGIPWIHEIEGGSSHASHNSTIAHFGLGEVTLLDSLVVIWPGGKKQKYEAVGVNQLIFVEEDANNYLVAGCTDQTASNYDANAEYSYGCYREVRGCLDQAATNFDMDANVESGDCIYEVIEEPLGIGYNIQASIFPNPLIDEATIQLSKRGGTELNVSIISMSGQLVFSAVTRNPSLTIRRGEIKPGIYLVNISGIRTNQSIRLRVN
ncbi:MAG: VCBS repeat-containing protein [Reichenbachiella sp.]